MKLNKVESMVEKSLVKTFGADGVEVRKVDIVGLKLVQSFEFLVSSDGLCAFSDYDLYWPSI